MVNYQPTQGYAAPGYGYGYGNTATSLRIWDAEPGLLSAHVHIARIRYAGLDDLLVFLRSARVGNLPRHLHNTHDRRPILHVAMAYYAHPPGPCRAPAASDED